MVAWVLADALVERFGGDRLDLMLQVAASAAADPRWSPPQPAAGGDDDIRDEDPDAER
jgi:hypothetical protein